MVSIVIPLYNKEISITNTLQSVFDQTFSLFEVIVVNDGSTDKSLEKVKAFNDNRIRIINQKNGGVSRARNRGIKEAKFEWIAFLDADDLWRERHLEEILKMMKDFPNEKIFVTSFEYSDGKKIVKYPSENNIFKVENYFKHTTHLIWTSIVVINKECFDKSGNFNPELVRGEDIDLWSRLGKKYNVIKTHQVTAIYRVDAENRSDKYQSVKKSFVSIIDLNNVESKEERNYYKELIIKKMKSYFVSGQWKNLSFLIRRFHFKLLK